MNRALTVTFVVVTSLVVGCGDAPVTFTRDVAPVVYEHCASCHRPGEAAPFDLLTYDDVGRRAEQIVTVTKSGYMPPWLPSTGHERFAGERRLSDEEIAIFAAWLDDGLVEGNAGDLPEAPRFAEGWQLGTPDHVATLADAYTLPAEGVDVIRNFVIPAPVTDERWIAAVEVRPGSKQVVHHAVLKIDRTRVSRGWDRREPGPGFSGMQMGNAEDPDGHIIVWTPGSSPNRPVPGLAWRIDPDSDIVLQLHMVPIGKPEPVEVSIGLYDAGGPPEHQPFKVMLRDESLEIPPGDAAYPAEDRFELPVEVDLLAIYPHAHYLGKTMRVSADLPDGGKKVLLAIDDWDFNWQGMYQYERPLRLPAGAIVRMDYTYDNSEANVRNPAYPPVHVRGGNRSTDEMATLALQVLPVDPADLPTLREAQWRKMVADTPDDPGGHYNLGAEFARQGRFDDAARHYGEALRLRPDDDAVHYNLGSVYIKTGRFDLAAEQFRKVVELRPRYAEAWVVRGWVAARTGDVDLARRCYETALRLAPELEAARRGLAALDGKN